jgi:hypothetical protein
MHTLFCLAVLLTFTAQSSPAPQEQSANPPARQQQPSNIPAEEAHFTPEQMKEYYRVYKNADVHYLRKVFDAYLRGAGVREDESKWLSQWDKDYYRSKFVVLSREDNPFGGTLITIMFQDRPDKVFVAWVYPEGGQRKLALRRFELDQFSEEDIRNMRTRYRRFLEDKAHAM